MLALFGRAEARDFIDVAALVARFGWPHLYKLAAEKDAGFDRAIFLDALYAFERLKPEQFDLDAEGYERLHHRVRKWRHDLQRELDCDRGCGRDQ